MKNSSPGPGIPRRRFIAGTGIALSGPAVMLSALSTRADRGEAQPAGTTRVHVHCVDARSGMTTPAMVCITSATNGEVRLPPDGRICKEPSNLSPFINGVNFDPDRNWIGPVRKMLGKGDNSDRSYVYEQKPSIPYWKAPVTYLTSGDFLIDLPAGRWQIAAGHGMEHVPVTEEFAVDGKGEQERTLHVKRWIDLPARGWWSGDVHVHHPSKDAAQREFLMQYAIAEDVHLVNLLEMGDHTKLDFPQAGFGKEFRVQRGNFALVSGQEDPRSTYGHIIGLNLEKMVRDTTTYDFYDLAFHGIKMQKDALVGFAHFAWNGCDLPRGFPWLVTTGEIDFIEALQFSTSNLADYADYLNLGFRLAVAAGSDTPWGSTIGEVRTYVHTGPEFSVDAWFRNLKAGRSFVSNGPALEFTVNGELPGSELKLAAGSKVKIRAKVTGHPRIGLPSVLKIESTHGVLSEIRPKADEPELTADLDHTVGASEWVMASAVCDNGGIAHTTPVYAIVKDRPAWNLHKGPNIIDKQLSLMAKVEAEVAKGEDARSAGIRERLKKAGEFYTRLRAQMAGA